MIDAHLHLQDDRFDLDRETLLKQAEAGGVTFFFCAATRPADWEKVIELAEKRKNIYPFIGTHPWYADQHNSSLLKRLLNDYSAAGIGEIGLDSIKSNPAQESTFEEQMTIAAEMNRPCVIHCVRSFDKVAACLKRLKKRPPALMFHGFSGTLEQAEFLSRFNAYFSFSGTALFPERQKLRKVIAALPADRLLVETDAPDMPPPFWKEKRNVPANLPLILEGIAGIRKTDAASFNTLLRQNAERFLLQRLDQPVPNTDPPFVV
ncbi:MAG: TatD family hydrolase [Alphaproteobacteria bacterium]|nr:TatD family hydrolase [Alphaproteobacteria bacterium]